MEDIKKKSAETTSSRAHPYKCEKAAAKQAAKDYNYYYYGCREQGYSWFTLNTISRMVCEGGLTPTLSMSESDKDYGTMYLRCTQRNCNLFQWWRFCDRCLLG